MHVYMYMDVYVFICVCEWIIWIEKAHLNAQIMSEKKVGQEKFREGNPCGQGCLKILWRTLDLNWALKDRYNFGKEKTGEHSGETQHINEDVGWSISLVDSRCMRSLVSHYTDRKVRDTLGKLDWGLGGMRIPVWGIKSF